MKYSHSVFLFILLFFVQPVFSQNPEKWTRIEFEDNKLSIAVPPTSIIDTEKRTLAQYLRIVAFQNNAELEINLRKSRSAADRISDNLKSDKLNSDVFKIGDFIIIKAPPTIAPGKSVKHSLTIVKDENLYVLFTYSKTGEEKEVIRFLHSIRIEGKSLFVQDENDNLPEESVSVSSLKTSPEIIEAEKRKTGKFKGKITYELRKLNPDDETEGLAHRALVIEKPYPRISSPSNYIGTIEKRIVKLKVQFRADGQIGDIIVLSNTEENFTKDSIDAARKIKFVPASRGGEFVDSFQIITYAMISMPTGSVIQ